MYNITGLSHPLVVSLSGTLTADFESLKAANGLSCRPLTSSPRHISSQKHLPEQRAPSSSADFIWSRQQLINRCPYMNYDPTTADQAAD